MSKKNKFYLITGGLGFIGFHLSFNLIKKNKRCVIIDNLNDYYSTSLKKMRLEKLKSLNSNNFIFIKLDLSNYDQLVSKLKDIEIEKVFHLAAQAGVRYSYYNQDTYIQNNLLCFFNIFKFTKYKKCKKILFASSSSVYGEVNSISNENDHCNEPKSLYAATKKCNEILAKSLSDMYNIKSVGLRFFTVYGTFGRPDMSLFKFSENILSGKKIELFNFGKHSRDFTYVDDVVYSIIKISNSYNKIFHSRNKNFSEIFNICSSNPVSLKKYLNTIEKSIGKKAKIKNKTKQKGDVNKTYGSNAKLLKIIGKYQFTNIDKGIPNFINWYLNEYKT